MEENYISILCKFLGRSLLANKTNQNDVLILLKDFYEVCDNVTTRGDLIAFLSKYTLNYPYLEELKRQLNDKDFIFKEEI